MILDEKKTLPPCPHCGVNMVNARLLAAGYDEEVFLHLCEEMSPDGGNNFLLVAWACTNCGYVELHAYISETESD